jgi:hypothetical protein
MDAAQDLAEGVVYLLSDYGELSEMQIWLKKHYDDLFCEQLNGWYTDETIWLSKRTYKIFCEWFDCSLHTMVLDTQKTIIEKV